MSSDYTLIEDLTKKLMTYSTANDIRASVYANDHNNSAVDLICRLILKSSLRTEKLSRTVVSDLLAGNIGWPKEDGTFHYIKTEVTVDELEKLCLIRFVLGELHVNGQIKIYEELSEESKKLIQAVNDLYEIKWGRNGLLRNQLLLEEFQAKAIVTTDDLTILNVKGVENLDFLKMEKDGKYGFVLSHNQIKPLGTDLWPLVLNEYENGNDALVCWIHHMSNVFDYPDIFQLDFIYQEHENIFLEAAIQLILVEPDFHNSWADEARKLLVERTRGQDIFYSFQHSISLTIGSNGAAHSEPPAKLLPYEIPLPEQFVLEGAETPDSLLSAYLWWSKNENIFGSYSDCRQKYYSLLHLIIRYEKQLYSPADSFKRIQKLLEACLERPWIAVSLLGLMSSPSLTCFLLRRINTATVAMMRIATDTQYAPSHLTSSYDYQEQWRSMIWRQSLEVFFGHFENLNGDEQLRDAANTVGSFLRELSRSTFTPGSAGSIVNAKDRFKEALTFLEQVSFKQYSNAPIQRLLKAILPFLPDVITRLYPSKSGEIPHAEWYLLFWCLEKSYWHPILPPGKQQDSKRLPARISESILDSYLRILNEKLDGAGMALDADVVFDQLNWAMLFEHIEESHKSSIIFAMKDQKGFIEGDEKEREKISAIRMHIRVLLAVYSRRQDHGDTESCEIAQELVDICSKYGFSQDRLCGIFDTCNDDPSSFHRVYLWEKVCAAANWFDDSLFRRLMQNVFKAEPPLKSILVLYKESVSEERRKMIQKQIDDFDISTARFTTIAEVRDAVLLAVNEDKPDLANTLLSFGKENAHRAFKQEWAVLDFKIALLSIYKDASLSLAERSDRISQRKIPEEACNTFIVNDPLKNDLERYRRFLQALLFFESEPFKCYQWLSALCNESNEPLYASNRLAACISFIEKDLEEVDKPLAYKQALSEWDEASKSFLNHTLNLHETNLLLKCYCFLNDVAKFNELWDSQPEYQQTSYEFVPVRVKFLQNNNLIQEALKYLDLVKSIHLKLSKGADDVVDDLKQELLAQQIIKLKEAQVYLPLAKEQRLTVGEARRNWNDILRLDDIAHAEIFLGSPLDKHQLEQFVVENVIMVSKELLLRSNNLLRQINNAKGKSQTIEDENIINDWFVSLFEQRLSYIGWSVADQKRTGRSDSGIDCGETDGWVSNAKNNRLFIFEAFKLSCANTTVIDEHIDKLHNYDPIGCSPLVVVAYCFVADFNSLCLDYIKHVGAKQYKGFDNTDLSPAEKRFEIVENKANLRVYKEIRGVNAVPTVLFHTLLSFKQ